MEQVTIQEFIKDTLVGIGEGVNDANQHFADPTQRRYHVFCLRNNKGDNYQSPGIRFEIAITAVKNHKGKAGLMVALLPLSGSANAETAANNELVHRITFEVGIEETFIGDIPGRA